MWRTIAAEIDASGNVKLLESVSISKPRQALLTILGEDDEALNPLVFQGNMAALLEVINSPQFVNRPGSAAAEIDAYIEEARNSWE